MKVSLTEFVDVVIRAGARKAKQVDQINDRHQQEYSVAKDFYKKVRDKIVATHKKSLPKHILDDVMTALSDAKKVGRYRSLIDNYKRWWGRSQFGWTQPPAGFYTRVGVTVVVNPELGLILANGESLIVKLYFKTQPLKRESADLITALMATTLKRGDVAILDVDRRKVFLPPKQVIHQVKMIDAELAYIAQLTSSFEKAA